MAYFDFTKFVSRLGIEDFIFLNPFTGHSVLLMFLVSLFYAVALANINVSFSWFEGFNVFDILTLGFFVLLVVLFKYVFLLVLNSLFGDNKLLKVHFFEFVRFFSLFGFLFLVFSIRDNSILSTILFFIYSIWLLWLLLELVRKSNYRKMYLISYLCISEVFPIFILMKQMGRW